MGRVWLGSCANAPTRTRRANGSGKIFITANLSDFIVVLNVWLPHWFSPKVACHFTFGERNMDLIEPVAFRSEGNRYSNFACLKAAFVRKLPAMPQWGIHDLNRTSGGCGASA